MNVEINLGVLTLAGFAIALILAAIAILDLLGLTNISPKLKAPASSLLVGAFGVLTVPYFAAIGRSISGTMGALLPMCFLLFIFCMVLIIRRSREGVSHN